MLIRLKDKCQRQWPRLERSGNSYRRSSDWRGRRAYRRSPAGQKKNWAWLLVGNYRHRFRRMKNSFKRQTKSTNTTSKSSKTPLKKPVSTSKGCLQLSKRKESRGQHLCRMQVIMRYARHCLPPSIRLDRRGVAPIRRCKHTLSRNQEQRSSIFSSWRTK